MTDKLYCPFCGSELRTSMLDEPVAWYCPNRCIGTYEPKVWRALIAGEKAQDALKVATDFIGFVNTSRHADGALAAMAICKLNKITSITKRE